MLGVDPKLIVANDQVAVIRQARNQAMAEKEKAAMLQQQADTVNTLAGAKTTDPSALTNVMDMFSGYNTP